MDLFELNRKVDRLLFDALPDKPEQAFERAANSNVLNRNSMHSLNQNSHSFLNKANSKTIGVSSYDSKKKKVVYSPITYGVKQKIK
jgi:hypothetical protein